MNINTIHSLRTWIWCSLRELKEEFFLKKATANDLTTDIILTSAICLTEKNTLDKRDQLSYSIELKMYSLIYSI